MKKNKITGGMPMREALFWCFVVIMTFFRIVLFESIPMDFLGNATHDDLLLVRHSYDIYQGNWLGEYDQLTLAKGFFFPFFVAACRWLCLTYSQGLALFYIFGVLVFTVAVRRLIKNPYFSGLVYLFLLYSPAMLSKSTQERVYNIALIPAGILLVTGSFTGIFLRRFENWKKLLPWGLLGGIGLVSFWYVREDSAWLLPFVLVAAGISIVSVWLVRGHWKQKMLSVVMMLLPFLIWGAAELGIRGVNQQHYGVSTVNERVNSGFMDVMGDLTKMEMPVVDEDVWISRATIKEACKYSPAMKSIWPQIKDSYKAWAGKGKEIGGDIIGWVIRDAVAAAGYYKDGASAEAFYQQVHLELTEAYEQGNLKVKEGLILSPLSKAFVFEKDFADLLQRSLKAWKHLLFIDFTEVEIFPSSGSDENLRLFEAMTGRNRVQAPDASGEDPYSLVSQRPVVYGQKLLKAYRVMTYPLVAVSVIFYIWMIFAIIGECRKKQFDTLFQWLIATGLGGCSAIMIVMVSWFTSYLGEADTFIYHYCTGSLTMIQLVQIITILWGIKKIKNTFHRK